MQLYFDFFKVTNHLQQAFLSSLQLDPTNEKILYVTNSSDLLTGEIASRLLLPTLSAVLAVGQIFKQLVRSVSSILTGRFSQGFKDILAALIQTIALPFIIVGSLLAPRFVNFLIQKILDHHEDYQEKFDRDFDKAANILISLLQIPSRMLEDITIAFAFTFTPVYSFRLDKAIHSGLKSVGFNLPEDTIKSLIETGGEEIETPQSEIAKIILEAKKNMGNILTIEQKKLRKKQILEKFYKFLFTLVTSSTITPLQGIQSSIGGVCFESLTKQTQKHFYSYPVEIQTSKRFD